MKRKWLDPKKNAISPLWTLLFLRPWMVIKLMVHHRMVNWNWIWEGSILRFVVRQTWGYWYLLVAWFPFCFCIISQYKLGCLTNKKLDGQVLNQHYLGFKEQISIESTHLMCIPNAQWSKWCVHCQTWGLNDMASESTSVWICSIPRGLWIIDHLEFTVKNGMEAKYIHSMLLLLYCNIL